MGDSIDFEIKKYVDKEIVKKFHELNKNIQSLTESINKQQQTIKKLQKKVLSHEKIITTCLCNKCENNLTCELNLL